MTNTFQPAAKLVALTLLISLGLSNPAHAFDRKKLEADGEVYAVALHDGYIAAARQPTTPRDAAHYFETRAKAIENGAKTDAAKPQAFPIPDRSMHARLQWAYEETEDTVTSEAADEAPDTTANVQIAYERWLIAMHDNPRAADAEALAQDFEARLDDLTGSAGVSARDAAGNAQLAARF